MKFRIWKMEYGGGMWNIDFNFAWNKWNRFMWVDSFFKGLRHEFLSAGEATLMAICHKPFWQKRGAGIF